jgi:hypothetical protein
MGKSSKRITPSQREEIGRLAFSEYSIAALSRKYNCTVATIARWLDEGKLPNPNYKDAHRRGRAPSLTRPVKNLIHKKARKGHTSRKICSSLSQRHVPGTSKSSVHRELASRKKTLRWLPIQRGKCLSPANKTKRLAFCKSHTASHFKTWVFTDAKDLYLYKSDSGHRQWAWQEPNKVTAGQGTTPWVFRFYAAVAHGRKSKLYFVPPSPLPGTRAHRSNTPYTAKHYVDMLKELRKEVEAWFPPPKPYRLVQDNATQHTAKETRDYISGTSLKVLEDWPPQAWDLNVIENVWGVLNAKLLGAKATSSDGWRKAIEAAWKKIDISTINKLVEGVGQRIKKVIDADGAWVPHH